MRAAVVTGFDLPLEVKEVPKPAPASGQILVHIEASGLCHIDIHAARGDWPVKPTPPFIPGHEGVGIVEELGAGVSDHAVGDRVALPLRVAAQHRLRDRWRPRRVRRRGRPVRRARARRHRPR